MSVGLRLYVWEGLTFGLEAAFALADSKEQAIELIVGALGAPDKWRRELVESQPHIVVEPKGFVVWGET